MRRPAIHRHRTGRRGSTAGPARPLRPSRAAGWRAALVLAALASSLGLAACGDTGREGEAAVGDSATTTRDAGRAPGDGAPGSASPEAGIPAGGDATQDTGAPGAPGGAAADTGAVAGAEDVGARDSAALAFDSLRREIRRLNARVERSTRATDSLLALVAGGAAGAAPASQGVAAGGVEGAEARILQDAAETARSYGIRAFWAVLVLVLTFFAVRAAAYALNVLSERSAERRLFFKRLVPIVRIVLWTFAVYFVIRVIFAVDAQGLFAAAAAVGVAIGFAAQDLLKNIFGGLVIVFDQPFQVGDKIRVGDSYGEVVSIGLRSTRIVTPDDSLVSVPNAQVVDSQVSNANSGALDCQVVTDLYLPGFVDEARAKAIAYQAAASSKYVYLQKPIVVLVQDEFRETFLTHLKVKAYVLDARYEFAFMSDVTERARAEFRRQGLMTPQHGARAWVNLAGAGTEEDR